MAVTVEKVGDRIWATAPYSPGIENRFKSIIGWSFSKSKNKPRWTYPLDIIICRDLRAEFKKDLIIGPELTAWAYEKVMRESKLLPLLTATDADLERVPKHAPLIWAAMNDDACMEVGCQLSIKSHAKMAPKHRIKSHRYQKPAALYMALAGSSQNASQPGLGKTIETLAAVVEAGVSGLVLVAAPKTSLRTVWEPEIQRWLPGVPVYATTGGRGRRNQIIESALKAWRGGDHSLVFLIINPEMLQTKAMEECKVDAECDVKGDLHKSEKHPVIKWYEHSYDVLFEDPWAGFVVDETHKYLLRVNLRNGKATQAGTGAMMLPLQDEALKIALSGTPWKGKPRNAWSVAHWLHGDVGLAASFWNWAFRMLQVEQGEYALEIGNIRDQETFNKWTDSFMIRHTKLEMAPWLPPKTYGGSRLDPKDADSPVAVWLDMEGKQATAYKSMLDNAMASLDNGTLTATGVLAERTRLKQFANGHGDLHDVMRDGELSQEFHPSLPSNKFDFMLEALAERGITGDKDEDGIDKVIIASQFTRTINLWADEFERMGIGCYRLTGETSDANRMNYVKEFQQPGSKRVFLLNTLAGGVAVTLDAADDLFFIDETDVPDEQEQVEDRTHRTSKIHNVTIWYLKSRGSIDEVIARQNMTKDMIQKHLLDGKRGVEFARRLLAGDKA